MLLFFLNAIAVSLAIFGFALMLKAEFDSWQKWR